MNTQSVLDQMTSAVVTRKIEAGAKLTPVGLEAGAVAAPLLPRANAPFPNDHPDEAILERISVLEEQIDKLASLDEQVEAQLALVRVAYAGIREALDAAKRALGVDPDAQLATPEDVQREKERAADARVAAAQVEVAATLEERAAADTPEVQAVLAHMDQKAAEAKAATFPEPSQPVGNTTSADTGVAPSGWACPVHHTFRNSTTRAGRAYRVCPEDGCKQFERLI